MFDRNKSLVLMVAFCSGYIVGRFHTANAVKKQLKNVEPVIGKMVSEVIVGVIKGDLSINDVEKKFQEDVDFLKIVFP